MPLHIGPQREVLEELIIGKPVRSALADLGKFPAGRPPVHPDPLIVGILALTPEAYARLVWSIGGHAVKTLLFDAGVHDEDAPGGSLCPPLPPTEEEDEDEE